MSNKFITTPNEADIKCGPGTGHISDLGNVNFREMREAHQEEYNSLGDGEHQKKNALVRRVYTALHQPPYCARFLTKVKKNDATAWNEMTEKAAMSKIKQAFLDHKPKKKDQIDPNVSPVVHASERTDGIAGTSSIPRTVLAQITEEIEADNAAAFENFALASKTHPSVWVDSLHSCSHPVMVSFYHQVSQSSICSSNEKFDQLMKIAEGCFGPFLTDPIAPTDLNPVPITATEEDQQFETLKADGNLNDSDAASSMSAGLARTRKRITKKSKMLLQTLGEKTNALTTADTINRIKKSSMETAATLRDSFGPSIESTKIDQVWGKLFVHQTSPRSATKDSDQQEEAKVDNTVRDPQGFRKSFETTREDRKRPASRDLSDTSSFRSSDDFKFSLSKESDISGLDTPSTSAKSLQDSKYFNLSRRTQNSSCDTITISVDSLSTALEQIDENGTESTREQTSKQPGTPATLGTHEDLDSNESINEDTFDARIGT